MNSVSGAVPAEFEQSKSIRLLTQKSNDSPTKALKKRTGDQRDAFDTIIDPEVVVKMDLVIEDYNQ